MHEYMEELEMYKKPDIPRGRLSRRFGCSSFRELCEDYRPGVDIFSDNRQFKITNVSLLVPFWTLSIVTCEQSSFVAKLVAKGLGLPGQSSSPLCRKLQRRSTSALSSS
jgi:hypothetical protein